MAEKYILRITAGADYDSALQHEVPVNSAKPIRIKSEAADVELNVRVQYYQGLPRGSPSTSRYFDTPPHDYNQDQYSIAFRFTPHKPAAGSSGAGSKSEDQGISGSDLQFGNDFDRPIRDKLPPGFNTALNIVKWWMPDAVIFDAVPLTATGKIDKKVLRERRLHPRGEQAGRRGLTMRAGGACGA